jgi:hypothetical protein
MMYCRVVTGLQVTGQRVARRGPSGSFRTVISAAVADPDLADPLIGRVPLVAANFLRTDALKDLLINFFTYVRSNCSPPL